MPTLAELPRLIATDLDGTLLRRDGSVSPRALLALKRARTAGIELVIATGRPPRHVAKIEGAVELGAIAICINGALTYDLERGAVVRESRLQAALAHELVLDLRRHLPGICFAVEVGLEFGWEPSYGRVSKRSEPPHFPVSDALALSKNGVSKLIARHPDFAAEELIARSSSILEGRASVSYSGAPFVEISAAHVSKASALAIHCTERSILPSQVLSFGDMPNDLPMLEWAGRSIAMANAHHDVLAKVREVTLSNEEDGVAIVVERLLAAAAVGSAAYV